MLLAVPLAALLAAADEAAADAGPAPRAAPVPVPVAEAVPAALLPEPSWTVPAAHAGGLLLGMRLTVSLAWPSAYDPTRWSEEREQLRRSFTRPPEFRRDRMFLESDGDPWWINGVGHAFFGSEVYGRARQCGAGPLAALSAAAGTSVVWEYGLEAPYKQPSAIDLVWTPLAGALLGEGRYRLQRWLRARDPRTWLLFVVDPLGESERRLFGTRC
jgi:hypothetical protein